MSENAQKHTKNKRLAILEADIALMLKSSKRLNREAAVFMRRIKKDTVAMRKEVSDHRSFLEKILSVNQMVEETLCKVLLAINQNEYLQAWYPGSTDTVKKDPRLTNH
jgi:hypothetical protein